MVYEYMTTKKVFRNVKHPEKFLKPSPPDTDWQLVSVCNIGSEVYYFWKRRVVQCPHPQYK